MPTGHPNETRPQRFLIVDDHASFRKTVRAFLPAAAISECSDGSEVVDRYAAELPDWVLMDIEMRGVDGLSATRELRRKFPDARVIIVSNHSEEEFVAAARELGTRGFVHKEHLEQLAQIIDGDESTKQST